MLRRFSLILASREQLERFCSKEVSTFMMNDFSFSAVKGPIDDYSVASPTFEKSVIKVLALWRLDLW